MTKYAKSLERQVKWLKSGGVGDEPIPEVSSISFFFFFKYCFPAQHNSIIEYLRWIVFAAI